ncbi:MAG TPA: LLM class flavin-dependent oxidoreductase [Dehalococcoidia bacterium]|nr:LLM class flavin-dependent oxidoreductase [Dehalococcoidia bacterium]
MNDISFAWYLPVEGDGHHLGTYMPERMPTLDYLRQVIRAAESSGFSEILIPTGTSNDSFSASAPMIESWTIASALAPATETIRLLVAVNPSCHKPGAFARQAATLDQLIGGRISVNLVAGGSAANPEERALDHAARYTRLGEFAQVVSSMWTEPATTFTGSFYNLDGALAEPKPVQDGGIPLYLGGASDQARELAARYINTYLMWGEPPAAIAERVNDMKARAARFKRTMRFGLRIHVIVRDSQGQAREAAAELLRYADPRVENDRSREFDNFDSIGQARMLGVPAGPDDWVSDVLWAGIRRVRGGAGTALVGTPQQVADALAEYVEAGVTYFILSGYPHLEEAARVGREVVPLVTRVTAPAG